MEKFYVLARPSEDVCLDNTGPYKFVSYNRSRGATGPIDLGLAGHFHAGHFAMSEQSAANALKELSGKGYEVKTIKYENSKDAIDLDQIVLDDFISSGLLKSVDLENK